MMDRRTFITHLTAFSTILSSPGRLLAANYPASPGTAFVHDRIYLEHWLFEGHPESPERLRQIMQAMQQSEIMDRLLTLIPLCRAESELYRIHSKDHVNQIKQRHPQSHRVAVVVVGGVLAAVDAVCQGEVNNAFCATRPPGHHATNTGKVEGFCLYNAVAIAARYAREKYNCKKVLIVDWDYHHGNGTEAAFYTDPDVLFFSTHDYYAYPGTGDPAQHGSGAGAGFTINVHLDCGAGDAAIVRAFKEQLIPAADSFRPDLILISAGFDSRVDDPLGCHAVTDNGFVELTEIVKSLAEQHCNGRIVSVLEGGYDPSGLASSVVAHVKSLNGIAA